MSPELDETVPYEQELGPRIADHLRREAGLADVGDLAVLPGGHSGLRQAKKKPPEPVGSGGFSKGGR